MERPLIDQAGAPLLILYSGGLGGDLDRLPRLYSFLRQRARLQPDSRLLLLDTGGSCAPTVWHCAATAGRSMLIALDAMGFHAALDEGGLDAASRERLRDNLLGLALVNAGQPFISGDVVAAAAAANGLPEGAALGISLSPAAHTVLSGGWLHLAAVQGMMLGEARVDFAADGPRLMHHGLHPLPPGTLPEPTLAGTVNFILSEARRYGKQSP